MLLISVELLLIFFGLGTSSLVIFFFLNSCHLARRVLVFGDMYLKKMKWKNSFPFSECRFQEQLLAVTDPISHIDTGNFS